MPFFKTSRGSIQPLQPHPLEEPVVEKCPHGVEVNSQKPCLLCKKTQDSVDKK